MSQRRRLEPEEAEAETPIICPYTGKVVTFIMGKTKEGFWVMGCNACKRPHLISPREMEVSIMAKPEKG